MPISHRDAELDREDSLNAYPFELFFWEAGVVIATHLAIALLVNLILRFFLNKISPALGRL
jgi:hypothetical protein